MHKAIGLALTSVLSSGCSGVTHSEFQDMLVESFGNAYSEVQPTTCTDKERVFIRFVSSSSSGFEYRRLSSGINESYGDSEVDIEIIDISALSQATKAEWLVAVSGINIEGGSFIICGRKFNKAF